MESSIVIVSPVLILSDCGPVYDTELGKQLQMDNVVCEVHLIEVDKESDILLQKYVPKRRLIGKFYTIEVPLSQWNLRIPSGKHSLEVHHFPSPNGIIVDGKIIPERKMFSKLVFPEK